VNNQELESQIRRRGEIERLMGFRYLSDFEMQEFESLERTLSDFQGRREQVFFEMLALLRRAERLGGDESQRAELRSGIFLEKWRLARADRNDGLAAFYREQVLETDATGRYRRAMTGSTRLSIRCTPPTAELHLFSVDLLSDRIHEGEPRLVPFPIRWNGAPDRDFVPGVRCRRVVEPADGLPMDALILDGAEEGLARVRIGDETISMVVPRDLKTRVTKIPLLFGRESRVPAAPSSIACTAGTYLVLARHEGFRSQRRVITIELESPEDLEVDLTLDAGDRAPPGFVRLAYGGQSQGLEPGIMEHEVTCGQYLAFLNAPRQRTEDDHRASRFPRTTANQVQGGYWRRDDDGGFHLGEAWTPDMPVLGISWEDAQAYARWQTEELRHAGFKLHCRLPSQWHYRHGSTGRYPWGDRFRPHWTKSCHARPEPGVEPVMSYPIDETLTGLFDVAGSAQEWCDDWFSVRAGERMIFGGAWAFGRPERFEGNYLVGALPNQTADTYGFRLIAIPDE
ncbi:MAG: SUMF1/EgtB/PvdO family nonheme iron enzyme, partial [Salinibacterium sp.]|nr:SUMF1/EgtB/PvdO family nonheme iron enzyme [Salinibacterium sp.]